MTLDNKISCVCMFWDDLSIIYSVTKVSKSSSCMVLTAPAAIPLDAGVFFI